MGTIIWLAGLVAAIWAILKIVKSRASTGGKVLWILIVLLLSWVGLVIWWFMGAKGK
jgi:hypothetical protein